MMIVSRMMMGYRGVQSSNQKYARYFFDVILSRIRLFLSTSYWAQLADRPIQLYLFTNQIKLLVYLSQQVEIGPGERSEKAILREIVQSCTAIERPRFAWHCTRQRMHPDIKFLKALQGFKTAVNSSIRQCDTIKSSGKIK